MEGTGGKMFLHFPHHHFHVARQRLEQLPRGLGWGLIKYYTHRTNPPPEGIDIYTSICPSSLEGGGWNEVDINN